LLQKNPLLGGVRIGSDLSNYGAQVDPTNTVARADFANRELIRLYHPDHSSKPAYKSLFELKPASVVSGGEALDLPADAGVPEGMAVVPTHEAKALVAYLMNLKNGFPLFESPLPPREQEETEEAL